MNTTPNYFELYQLPVTFHPDGATVKKKYYELSRLYHPDRYAQAGGDALTDAMHHATLNNLAYKTLSNTEATLAYILHLHGCMADEAQYKLPPDFLMEMMELNEAVSDYEDQADNAAMQQQVTEQLQSHMQALQTITDTHTQAYDGGDHNEALLLKIKDCYFRKKYLLRIKERIDTFAAR
jgi:molecular chaperone HscB